MFRKPLIVNKKHKTIINKNSLDIEEPIINKNNLNLNEITKKTNKNKLIENNIFKINSNDNKKGAIMFTNKKNTEENKFNNTNINNNINNSILTFKELSKKLINEKEEAEKNNYKKKEFLPESVLKQAKTKEDLNIIYGVEKKDYEIKKEKRQKEIEKFLKENIYTLPDNLIPNTNDINNTNIDSVDNLIKLSKHGLVEVPLSIEDRIKNIKATEEEFKNKILLDNKIIYKIDILKDIHSKGTKLSNDVNNEISYKTKQSIDSVFKNVIMNFNGKKRKHE